MRQLVELLGRVPDLVFGDEGHNLRLTSERVTAYETDALQALALACHARLLFTATPPPDRQVPLRSHARSASAFACSSRTAASLFLSRRSSLVGGGVAALGPLRTPRLLCDARGSATRERARPVSAHTCVHVCERRDLPRSPGGFRALAAPHQLLGGCQWLRKEAFPTPHHS